MKFFSTEGGLYQFMSRLFQIVKLNLLWLLCSIPIVTMGAASIAVYTITLKMVDEREGYIARPFFKAFRENLKQGVILEVITVVCFYAVYMDFQLFNAVEGNPIVFLMIGILSAIVCFLALIYAYPLAARYENKISRILRNSFDIAVRFPVRTLALVLVLALEFVIMFWNTTTLFFAILIGPVCVMFTISGFARYFFRVLEKEPGAVSNPEDLED
ncbi:MAG: YesL family protein [Lachnospiraceae bacterium]|nr:YesL family protein [Lachnospiraceae bacterium]MCD7841611.1 YesL family protein [Lachnospiraceae bacterium]